MKKDIHADISTAMERAKELLLGETGSEGDLVRTAYTQNYGGPEWGFFRLENQRTGKVAVFFQKPESGWGRSHSGDLFILTKEEEEPDRRLWAFGKCSGWQLAAAIAYHEGRIFKPAYLNPAKALMPGSVNAVNRHLGKRDEARSFMWISEYGEKPDQAFGGSEGRRLAFRAFLLPADLEKITKRETPIKTIEDYTDAVGAWLHRELSDAQRAAVRDAYIKNVGDLLIRFGAYEFYRTESYERLAAVLTSLPRYFGLPSNWHLFLWGGECQGVLQSDGGGLTVDTIALAQYAAMTDESREAEIYMTEKNTGVRSEKEIESYSHAPKDILRYARWRGKNKMHDYFD